MCLTSAFLSCWVLTMSWGSEMIIQSHKIHLYKNFSCIVRTGLPLMLPCNHIYYIRTSLFYIIVLIKPYQKLLQFFKFLRTSVNEHNYSEIINCKNTVLGKSGDLLVLCLTYLSTWKIDVMCSSKMLGFLQTTQCYNSEDHILYLC
jgi:hypothetical protein